MNNTIKQVEHPVFGTTTIFYNKLGKTAWIGTEIKTKLGIQNIHKTSLDAGLELGRDYVVIKKKGNEEFFAQVSSLNLLNAKTPTITLIFESGLWLLCQNSTKPVGKKLRRWLADEVLPSISRTGKYENNQPKKISISQEELLMQTKRVVQIDNSKKINDKNHKVSLHEVIDYNYKNCLQVTGKSPAKIKADYDKNKSAKENLRLHHPELAATLSLNDHLLVNSDELKLSDLKQVDKSFPSVIRDLLNLGIEIKTS